ncbi:uncharacterized protein LOC133187130 [Saccostrea echinata]|uniref:uncharacterized protein LOC133187130 n=1 Tax=Saccostrea echinata TaxID=191078 RepID=UPI002A825C7E|nr:uncharacterized protein LOC133187130 [Saccostrea echinata]
MRILLRKSLDTISEEEEENVECREFTLIVPSQNSGKSVRETNGLANKNRNNTAEDCALSSETSQHDTQTLQHKSPLQRDTCFQKEPIQEAKETKHLKPLSIESSMLHDLHDPACNEIEDNEEVTSFRKLIQKTCDKLFKKGNKRQILMNKYTFSEISKYNLSQNANTTPEPDRDNVKSESNEAEQKGKEENLENQISVDDEAAPPPFVFTPQSSFEEKFGHLSIFAPQTSTRRENETDAEAVSRAIVGSMLEQCIESVQKPTINSRLSSRNAYPVVPSMSAGTSVSRIKGCSNQEIAHLESEMEKKISTEKSILERENDCQFGHGDGEALLQTADDIEILRRQRMERLQELRNLLDQKRAERKAFENKMRIKYGIESEKDSKKEMAKMEQIKEEQETEEDQEGVAIVKAPTHIDVHTAPARKSIKSIYREVECVQDSSSTDNSDFAGTDNEGCDGGSVVVLSDLDLRTYTETTEETNFENSSLSTAMDHSSPTGETKKDHYKNQVFDKITIAQGSKNVKPNITKNPYAKYERTGKMEQAQRPSSSQTLPAEVDVSDAKFWKNLDDGKFGNTNQFYFDPEGYVGQCQDMSQWVTEDLCPSEDNDITGFYENCSYSSAVNEVKTDTAISSVVFPDDLMGRARPRSKKKDTGSKKKSKEKKEKKSKIKENSRSGHVSLVAETESILQKLAYFQNEAHLEESKEVLEEKRRELRDAENLLYFRAMARDGGWRPTLEPLPNPHGMTSVKHSRLTGFGTTKDFCKPSDIDSSIFMGGNRRNVSAIPNDPGNYISEAEAEENMMFFKYVARNRSFFKFKERD